MTNTKKVSAKKPAAKVAPAKKSAKKTGVAAPKKAKVKSERDELEKEANRLINSAPKKKSVKRKIKPTTEEETGNLLEAIVEGMKEKKAKNITVLNMRKLDNRIADYFVICDAESNTHVEAIAYSVEEETLKRTNEKPYHSEGFQVAEWILLDYVNIVVHIFQREIRNYYAIEDFWADAEITKINE